MIDLHLPDQREVRAGNVVRRAQAIFEIHLHVGLTRAEPDVTDDHVVQHNGVLAGDRQVAAGRVLFLLGQPDLPPALRVGCRLDRRASEGHLHLLARIGLADADAGADLRELRELLQGWRDARSGIWGQAFDKFVRGVMALLLAALAVQLGLGDMLQ